MSNGQGFEVKVPWWVQAIGVVGVTATIALYLVYWVTNMATQQMIRTETEVAQVAATLTTSIEILKTVQESEVEIAKDLVASQSDNAAFRRRELNLVMQACINGAKSPYQVEQCKERMGGNTYMP